MKNIMAHWKTTTGNSTRYQPGTWYHTYLVDLPNKKLCRASSFSTRQCVKMGTMFPFHFLHTHHSKGQVRARDWCHLVSGNLPGSTWYTWYQCCITHSITCPCTAKDDFCFFVFCFYFPVCYVCAGLIHLHQVVWLFLFCTSSLFTVIWGYSIFIFCFFALVVAAPFVLISSFLHLDTRTRRHHAASTLGGVGKPEGMGGTGGQW